MKIKRYKIFIKIKLGTARYSSINSHLGIGINFFIFMYKFNLNLIKWKIKKSEKSKVEEMI